MEEQEQSPGRRLVTENVETIAALRARHEERIPRQQRAIASLISSVGRPQLLWAELGLIGIWIGFWAIERARGQRGIDPPPFFWLQGLVGLSALLLTTMVLITQNRQRLHSERRAHLDTQMNLLIEQKVAKLISLVEELRRDLPVPKRKDTQAEAMQSAIDPHEGAAELDERLETDEPRNR